MATKRRFQAIAGPEVDTSTSCNGSDVTTGVDLAEKEQQPRKKLKKSGGQQQGGPQDHLDSLLVNKLDEKPSKLHHAHPPAVKSNKPRQVSDRVKAALPPEDRYEKRMAGKHEAAYFRYELKLAREDRAELELAIRELGDEAEENEVKIADLEKKLKDEKVAATLGWNLLWNQKRHIEYLEKQMAAYILLDLRKGDWDKEAACILLGLRKGGDTDEQITASGVDQHQSTRQDTTFTHPTITSGAAEAKDPSPNPPPSDAFKGLQSHEYIKKLEAENIALVGRVTSLEKAAKEARQKDKLPKRPAPTRKQPKRGKA